MSAFAPLHSAINTVLPPGFTGPGVYRILLASAATSVALEASVEDELVRPCEIIAEIPPAEQCWTFEVWPTAAAAAAAEAETGLKYKIFTSKRISSSSRKKAAGRHHEVFALEAFPRDGVVRPKPPAGEASKHGDQLWSIDPVLSSCEEENVGTGKQGNERESLVRICCNSKSQGVVYLDCSTSGMVGLNPLNVVASSQLFKLKRLDKRTIKAAFTGPGLYRVLSASPHATGKALESFAKSKEIRPRDLVGDNVDQHWQFIDQGDFFLIQCNTEKGQGVVWEAFPREGFARVQSLTPANQDQWWQLTELGDGKTVKIHCQSKSRGLVCLELPQGGTHCIVAPPSTGLTQLFTLHRIDAPPPAFGGPGVYRLMHAKSNMFLEAFPSDEALGIVESSQSPDQRWAFAAHKGGFTISCHTKNTGSCCLEAFPRDDIVRPKATSRDNQDQVWFVEEIGDSIHIKLYCNSKSRGRVYLEQSMGFEHTTVRPASENPGQLFRVERAEWGQT